MKKLCSSLMLIFVGVLALAQGPVTITGTVTDANGEPLPGAGVQNLADKTGVVTDIDGNYSISMTIPGKLQFSFIGMASKDVEVKNAGSLNVVLQADENVLEDVVVIGYGTLEKRQVTSSITSIKSSDLIPGGGGATMATALQGKISGMTINTTSSPNSDYSFQLRGVTSINASDDPLIVIDGIPGGHFTSINPEDVVSIDVLKDASAGAIYGTRAAGGVILITTKQAAEGPVKVTYTGEASTESIRRMPEVLSRERFLKYKLGSDYGYDTDWYSLLLNKGAISQRHSINVSGGGKNAKIYANFMTQNQHGIALGDNRKDYQGRINGSLTFLKGKGEIIFHSEYHQINRDMRSSSENFQLALSLNPTMSAYDEESESGYNIMTGGYSYSNPLADIMLKQIDRQDKYMSADASLKFHLPFNLTSNTTFGWQDRQYKYTTYYSKYHTQCVDNGYDGLGYQGLRRTMHTSLESTLSWIRSFNDHNINAVAGYSYWKEDGSEYFSMTNYDFAVDGMGAWNMGGGTYLADGKAAMTSSKQPSEQLISFFGRANYNYRDKYMVMASIRHEGSSKFGKDHQWGTFWSLSGGWRISKEPFMRDIRFIDDLKLRVGYGVTGNNNFSAGSSTYMYSANSTWYYNGKWIVTYGPGNNVNNDLHWEQKSELNIGLDYAFLGNRLYGKFDWYKRYVNGMLYEISVPNPPAIYATTMMNYGNLESQGWEFEIGGVPYRKGDFSYSTSARFSHNSSKITSLWGDNTYEDRVSFPSPGNPGTGGRIEEGTQIGSYYIWKYAGITDDGKWLIYDKDDNIILADNKTYEDKRYIGNAIPKLIISWDHNLSYKNWGLIINLRSWIKYDVFNTINMYYGLSNVSNQNVIRAAFIQNRHIKQEKLLCDYWLEDGTFLKVDNVSLSYTLPLKKITQDYVESARFYITAHDLFCFSKYSGLNPEVNINGLDPGYEWFTSIYPQTRKFTLGVKLSF